MRLSEVLVDNELFRIESEYFYSKYLDIISKLKNLRCNKLIDICKVITNGHTPLHHNLLEGNIKFITAEFIDDFILNTTNKFILQTHHDLLLKRSKPVKGDILFTIKGKVGNAVPIYKALTNYNINQDVAKITLKILDDCFVISAFLNCKYGKLQVQRLATGQINPFIGLGNLKDLLIPTFGIQFKKIIESYITFALKIQAESQTLYAEAEKLLLEELDLFGFKPSTENIAVKKFSESFGSTGRLDAEYYQDKYEEILKIIKQKNFELLGNIVNIKKSIEPGSDSYTDSGIPFIRVADITKYGLTETDIRLSPSIFANNLLRKLQPQRDTILFSKDGTIGIAYNIKTETGIITSSALLHLTLKNNDVLPEYLTLVLNSTVTQMQGERDVGGSIVKHWLPSQIQKILIPITDIKIQKEIEDKIQQSFNLSLQSKRLLEIAKQAVEMAIEQNEEIALKWLEQNTSLIRDC